MDLKPSALAVCFYSSPGSLADNFYTLCRALAPRTRLSILTSETMRSRAVEGAQETCYLDVHKERIGRLLSPALWTRLWKFSRRQMYDLVFFYSEHPVHAVVRHVARARRSLFWCLDPAPHSGSKGRQIAMYEIAKRSLMHADRIAVACEGLAHDVAERYHIEPGRIISSFHGVLDNLCFTDLPDGPRDIDVLFFGRQEAYKGLDVLFEAIRRLQARGRNVSVRAVGPGSGMTAPPGVVVDNRYVADRELAELVTRARIVVMPYRDATGSQVPQTAFFYGTPVVASAVGCLTEYIEDGVTGLLVPPADPDKLADAMDRLLGDRVLWDTMSRNARERVRTTFANGPLMDRLLTAALR
jgi:glycosyltransferase involved in cell wall biosynthesis